MMNRKIITIGFCILATSLLTFSCKNTTTAAPQDKLVIPVDKAKFLNGGLAEPITIETRTLSDGSSADCYKIVVKSTPTDHAMGPWCPTNISDDASAGGIWLENGKVYDVDGAFVKNLAQFYKDSTWAMYNKATGAITKTKTEADCREAANPNVGEEYKNYCVECLPSYVANLSHTYYIPVRPKAAAKPYEFSKGPGGPGGPDGPEGHPKPDGERGPKPSHDSTPSTRGLAFNGIVFDAPAPTDRILGAYTLAPFDDAGGHINLNAGYHYHAATGLSTRIAQTDQHAAMIGYAMDGYGLYENTDSKGTDYKDLDALRGHYDSVRGYHYHVDKAGNNNFINGLRGEFAE
ncbi:YHYH protein [Flavobacterium algicola]|uniref:YHYH protein n=1 Tax=Flavobacterium algicola TaxID=556529 RepID=UPI001EFC8626|nr:YHYH protein [Flavobacterium algicola]MCG9792928.1 YHYH protein [Flavobacterium algicola]